MIGVATTIKDNLLYTLFFRTLGNKLTNFTRNRDFSVVSDRSKGLNGCPGRTPLSSRQYRFRLSNGTSLRAALLGLSTFRLRLCRGLFGPGTLPSGWSRLGSSFHSYRNPFRLHSFWLPARGSDCRFKVAQALIKRRSGCQCLARGIVYDLRIDMMSTAEYIQAWTCL